MIEFPFNSDKIQITIIIFVFYNHSLIDVLLCPFLLTFPMSHVFSQFLARALAIEPTAQEQKISKSPRKIAKCVSIFRVIPRSCPICTHHSSRPGIRSEIREEIKKTARAGDGTGTDT